MKKIFYNLFCLTLAAGMLVVTGCNKSGDKNNRSSRGGMTIKTSPKGADVIIRNKKRGTTPFVRDKVVAGNYIVELHKAGYQTVWRRVVVMPGKMNQLNVPLKPLTASVLLVSSPNHVKIYIKDKFQGETPLLLKRLPLGKYSIRAEKDNFSGREISWELTNARPKKIIIALVSNVAKVTINTVPANCLVTIDNQPRGAAPVNLLLEEGKHTIKVSRSGFASREESINLTRNHPFTKTYTLKQLPGGLSITTTPTGAAVYVNNRACGNSPVKLNGLPPGKYRIKVTKENFDTQTVIVNVDPDRITKKSFTMSRNTGGIDLVVNPPGTTVYLNGKLCGRVEKDNSGSGSKIFHLRGLKAGEYEIKIAHKRGLPPARTYKIIVKKGKISRPEKPLSLWVPDTRLRLTGGRSFDGILIYKSPDGSKIMFSPEPGIQQEFTKSEIISMKHIHDVDE